MKRFLPIFAAALVLAAGALSTALPRGDVSLGAAHAQEAVEIKDMTLGDPNAPVTMIEYASYTCPHCRTFHEGALKDIKAEYIDTGKVRFIYREVYFDRPGLWASMIARCGGELRFFGISDLIYAGQQEWTKGDGATVYENLRQIGKVAGLSDAELDVCMSDAAQAEGLYNWYQANAEADGIRSTPSFVIDGKSYSNMSLDDFRATLDAKLGE